MAERPFAFTIVLSRGGLYLLNIYFIVYHIKSDAYLMCTGSLSTY